MAPVPEPPSTGPRTIGKFQIVREIGHGGMGIVYEVADPVLGNRRALKMMLETVARKPGAKQRFLEEAKVMAAIDHDHVVMVLDYGEYDGQPYLVMPLLQGRTLEAALRAGGAPAPLAPALAFRIAEHVARGLAAVHARKLVHRDIKPGNIWLEESADGALRRAKVMDFGIARDEPGQGEEATQEAGTVGYMSMEQLYGTHIGPKTDLFSLGVVAYRMLAGAFPYTTKSWGDYHEALRNRTPADLHTIVPGIPRAASDLIARMIDRSVDARPGDAEQVADQFARFVDAKPSADGGDPWWKGAAPEPPVARPAAARPIAVATPVTNANRAADANTVPDYEKGRPDWLPDSRAGKVPAAPRPSMRSRSTPDRGNAYPYAPTPDGSERLDPRYRQRPSFVRRVISKLLPVFGILAILGLCAAIAWLLLKP